MFNILAWILLGVIAGAIAKAIVPGYQGGGFLQTAILGIIGSFLGGTLLDLITTGTLNIVGSNSLGINNLITAILGAILAIFIGSFFTRRA
jgi:uncharacterized membrane protein YeaQ/YmgE (transglycosylase-associated protein family)